MTLEILLIIAIILLLGYIVFLHIRIVRKNLFIESTVKRLAGIEQSWSPEEMMRFLHEIKKVSHYGTFFTDKLFEEKPMGFLLEDEKNSKIYIHYTKEEADARNIIRTGFRFADSFYKTALPVSHDRLDLLIKHNGRKSFGDYLIIICISEKIFRHYSEELDKSGLKGFVVENVLTVMPPFRNENGDIIYQLSNRFVKGYINHKTGEIIANPEYNPLFDSALFMQNLDLLKKRAAS
ncbi:MAG: hypothetical protein ABSA76_04155 [Bacteroidales bacterium]